MIPYESIPDGSVLAPHHVYIGLFLVYFGFKFVWPYYPKTGMTLTLLGVAIQLDDLLNHAFGVWTPLDALWNNVLLPLIG